LEDTALLKQSNSTHPIFTGQVTSPPEQPELGLVRPLNAHRLTGISARLIESLAQEHSIRSERKAGVLYVELADVEGIADMLIDLEAERLWEQGRLLRQRLDGGTAEGGETC
jgi:hypothetical protein